MVRWNWIVGIVLIVLGGVLLLGIFRVFWPVVLIAVGVLFVVGATSRRQDTVREQAAIPLEGAEEASVRIRHGAGRLLIGAGAAATDLLSGSFGGGLDVDKTREGRRLALDLRVKNRDMSHVVFPWTRGTGGALDWDMVFNPAVPLQLTLETGASESRLTLTDLQVRDLRVSTGASSTTVDLPARAGHDPGAPRVRRGRGKAARPAGGGGAGHCPWCPGGHPRGQRAFPEIRGHLPLARLRQRREPCRDSRGDGCRVGRDQLILRLAPRSQPALLGK